MMMNAFNSDWQTAPLKPPRDSQCEYVKLWIIQRITSTVSTCNHILQKKKKKCSKNSDSVCLFCFDDFCNYSKRFLSNNCQKFARKLWLFIIDQLQLCCCCCWSFEHETQIFQELINRFSHSIFICACTFAYNSLRSNLIKTHRVSLICCNLKRQARTYSRNINIEKRIFFIEFQRVKLQYEFA